MSGKNGDAIQAGLAIIGEIGPDIGSIWRHRKGGAYVVTANAIREADLVPVVVYTECPPAGVGYEFGVALTWVRPLVEFADGRFTLMARGTEAKGERP